MIPEDSNFWPKLAEHDLALTSFMADLSDPRNNPSVIIRWIDEERRMGKMVLIPAFFFDLLKD